MLVIGRRVDETVAIIVPPSDKPQTIEIKVTLIRGGLIKLGFDADRSIRVHRKEVIEAIAKDGERKPAKQLPLLRIGDPLPGA